MKPSEYIKLAAVTDLKDYSVVQDRLSQEENARLFHYLVGISTESGELLDAIKKSIVYGKPLDKVNLIEELGDTLWYIARACDTLNISMEEVMEINIDKLKKRYGDKFSEAAALERDLVGERDILVSKTEVSFTATGYFESFKNVATDGEAMDLDEFIRNRMINGG